MFDRFRGLYFVTRTRAAHLVRLYWRKLFYDAILVPMTTAAVLTAITAVVYIIAMLF